MDNVCELVNAVSSSQGQRQKNFQGQAKATLLPQGQRKGQLRQ